MDAVFSNVKVARANPSKDGEKMYLRLLDLEAAEVVQITVPAPVSVKTRSTACRNGRSSVWWDSAVLASANKTPVNSSTPLRSRADTGITGELA